MYTLLSPCTKSLENTYVHIYMYIYMYIHTYMSIRI